MIFSNDKERSQINSAIRTEWVGNIEKTYAIQSQVNCLCKHWLLYKHQPGQKKNGFGFLALQGSFRVVRRAQKTSFKFTDLKYAIFKNCLGIRPKMETNEPNVYSTILGGVSRGFWSPFEDLGAPSATFWHLKTGTFGKSACYQVPKNGTLSSQI